MSDTYLIVLAVEVENDDPGTWDWPTLIDNPLPVDMLVSIEADPNEGVAYNLERLAHIVQEESMLYSKGEYDG